MTRLRSDLGGMCWISVYPEGYAFTDMEETSKWLQFKRQLLERAYGGRKCWLITSHPLDWSITHNYPDKLTLRTGGTLQHAVCVEQLSGTLLDEIIACPDFEHFGTLWIVLFDNQTPERLERLILEESQRGERP